LSPREQQAVSLFLDGYSIAKIGERLRCSPEAVATMLGLARDKMKEQVDVAISGQQSA
jgi:DNA-directed RNA polymerase specialized sigma24 family protein